MDSKNSKVKPSRKFILVDQSITDFSGHHYEYAHRVLKSAEKAGFDPILITNRKFQDQDNVPFTTVSIYQYGLWLTFSKPTIIVLIEDFIAFLNNRFIHIKAKFAFSTYAMIWLNKTDIPRVLSIISRSRMNIFSILFLLISAVLGSILMLLRLVLLIVPFKSYFASIFSAGLKVFNSLLKPIKLFLSPNNPIQKAVGLRLKTRAFTRDTNKWLRKISPKTNDCIFIPTLGTEELTGLIPILGKANNQLAGWHLLFRRNIFIGRNPEYHTQEEELRSFKNHFKRVYQTVENKNLFFYTDTEELTNQYNRIGTYTFKTLPIPAADKNLVPQELTEAKKPINIIYTGDARTEKGYHYFPNIIRDLDNPYLQKGQVSFTLQSNFNIPGGEPKPRIAKVDLKQLGNKNVKLLDKVLTSEEYSELLHSGDLIPILYDAENYYARSSGIFVEAAVLGKPMLVPAGTWMAKELTASINEYCVELLNKVKINKVRTMKNTFWHVNGKPKSKANDDTNLILMRNHVRYSYIAVPNGSTHMMIKMNQCPGTNGNFIKIFVQELIRQDRPIKHQIAVVGGQGCTASALFKLSSDTRRIWTSLSNAYSEFPLEVEDIEFYFISSERNLPLSSTAMIYSKESQISSHIKEMVDNYSHYFNTAQQFGKNYSKYHQPDKLLAEILAEQKRRETSL